MQNRIDELEQGIRKHLEHHENGCVYLSHLVDIEKSKQEMLFEEWAGNPPVEFENMREDEMSFWCWKAWQKATQIEREACAKACEDQATEPECPERAMYCAEAIRNRANYA